jgi:hypothetical protein
MQNIRKNFLSVKDAAELAGVNRMTIWRAVVKGEIEQLAQPAQEEQAGKKRVIRVQKDSLEAWIAQRPVTPAEADTEHVTTVTAQLEHVTSQLAQPAQEEQAGQKRVIRVQKDSLEAWIAQRPVTPAEADTEHVTTVTAQLEHVTSQLAQPAQEEQAGQKRVIRVQKDSLEAWIAQRPVTPAEADTEHVTTVTAQLEHVTSHLAQVEHEQLSILSELAFQTINKALERASQAEQRLEQALARAEAAERQSQSLHFELRSYQQVLTEQASSLAEERAHRLTLEQQHLKLATPKSGRLPWGERWRRLLGLKTNTG